MISYSKLFTLLINRGMKKTDLLKVISSPTLAKLSKGEVVKTDIIERICTFLKCQPGDIMEYIDEEEIKNRAKRIDEMQKGILEILKEQGYTQNQIEDIMHEAIKEFTRKAFSNGTPMLDMVTEGLENIKNMQE